MACDEDVASQQCLQTSTLSNSDYILGRVSNLWESKLLTDVSLKIQGKVLKAHKVILSASSEYFKAMFCGRMKESTAKTVVLEEERLVYEAVQTLFVYMYKGKLDLTIDNVFDVLVAADYLQVTRALAICWNLILEEVLSTSLQPTKFSMDVYRRACSIADRNCLAEIREAAERKLALSYGDIAESTEFKEQVTLDELQRVLLRNDLVCPNETFVFLTVLQWVDFDRKTRMCHVAELLQNVRLALVDIDIMMSEFGEIGLQEIPECRALLLEASLYHRCPSLSSKFALEFGKPRVASEVLVAFGKKKVTYFFDLSNEKRWNLLTGMAKNPCRSPHTAVLSGQALYLSNSRGRCYKYSISDNQWFKLPSMKYEKENLKLCVLGDYLYALGGSDPERYSFIKKQWECIEAPLESQPQEGVAFAAFGGNIFAIGGIDYNKWPSCKVFLFNPITNTWKPIAMTNLPHQDAVTIVENGVLYVAGGTTGLNVVCGKPNIDHIVERYDNDDKTWHCVPQEHMPPTDHSAFEIDGKVFFIKDLAVYESSIRIRPGEKYHVSLDGWKEVQSLPSSFGSNYVCMMMPLPSKFFDLAQSDDSSSESN